LWTVVRRPGIGPGDQKPITLPRETIPTALM
jgi:hypothetical protein